MMSQLLERCKGWQRKHCSENYIHLENCQCETSGLHAMRLAQCEEAASRFASKALQEEGNGPCRNSNTTNHPDVAHIETVQPYELRGTRIFSAREGHVDDVVR